jgi:malate dehydrogenase (oxaloacetate-decarboxylating)
MRGQEYDDFIEDFVNAVQRRWPHILLQWEDFAGENALRILGRYRDRLCTFNDDIQGTAAVTTGALFAAVNATGIPLRDQRIAMFGSGSAGVGIIALLIAAMKEQGLSEDDARGRIYAFNRHGLIVEGDPSLRASQVPLARKKAEVASWLLSKPGPISLHDTMKNARITALVGVSAQAGAFTEEVVRSMARNTPRPVIFPLSNPTSVSEAEPEDLFRWTDCKALVGTGSPFPPVEADGRPVRISQINNSYIFPGLALGILVSRATRVTEGMMMAAAKALAAQSPTVSDSTAPLLPRVSESRRVATAVAQAVACQSIADGVSEIDPTTIADAICAYVWEPVYHPYERVFLHARADRESPDFAI